MTLSFPSSPINGAVSGEYTYDATKGAWRKNAALPVSVTHSDVAPSNPRVGDQWWKSNEGTLFTYYNDGNSSQWVESTNVVANVEPNPIPAGAMMAWASDVIPANWLLCDGTAVSRSTYASLFAIIGTQYGAGDGTTTFNLPNLKGRTIVGKDSTQTEFDVLGETGGAKTHTLTTAEMPSHTHNQIAHSHSFSGTTTTNGNHSHTAYGISTPTGSGSGYLGLQTDGNLVWYRGNGTNWAAGGGAGGSRPAINVGGDMSTSTSSAGDHSHTFSGTTGNTTAANEATGGGGAHNNLQPYIVLNYIIKFSAGETPGDSQLAVRVGALETQNNATPLSQNYLINGAFDIWQRGTSGFTAGYFADRWFLNGANNGSRSTDVPSSNFLYSAHAWSSSNSYAGISQRIESVDAKDLVGKTITVSAWFKRTGTTPGSSLTVNMDYANAIDNFSSSTYVGFAGLTLSAPSTSWTRYSATFTVSVPAQAVNGLMFTFKHDGPAGSNLGGYWTGLQVEVGSYATPFRRNAPNTQAELAACQRHFQAIGVGGNSSKIGWGNIFSGTQGIVTVKLNQTMRAAPTFSYSGSLANYSLHVPGIVISNVTALSMDNSSVDAATLAVTAGSGFTAGHACVFQSNVVGAAVWFSADI